MKRILTVVVLAGVLCGCRYNKVPSRARIDVNDDARDVVVEHNQAVEELVKFKWTWIHNKFKRNVELREVLGITNDDSISYNEKMAVIVRGQRIYREYQDFRKTIIESYKDERSSVASLKTWAEFNNIAERYSEPMEMDEATFVDALISLNGTLDEDVKGLSLTEKAILLNPIKRGKRSDKKTVERNTSDRNLYRVEEGKRQFDNGKGEGDKIVKGKYCSKYVSPSKETRKKQPNKISEK